MPGSLLYRQEYPGDIEALIVMAPYIGDWEELTLYRADRQKFIESSGREFLDLWDSLEKTLARGTKAQWFM